jgi:AcrR family transcriptional regulator
MVRRVTAAETRRSYLGYDARRTQLLGVASRLFSERGYDAVSTVDIAREAGIARGLIHHHFGTKRELYIEVVRRMLEIPDDVFGERDGAGPPAPAALAAAVDRWLDTVSRHRETWLTAVGNQGPGRDPQLEAVLRESREQIAARLMALAWGPPDDAPVALRVILEGYAAFAQAVCADWLTRGRLTRAQMHELLLKTLQSLIADVLPAVQQRRATPSEQGSDPT